MREYHTLLVRESGRWCIHFGAFDRNDVAYERIDIVESGAYRKRDTKIITTGPLQRQIDATVNELNAVLAEEESYLQRIGAVDAK